MKEAIISASEISKRWSAPIEYLFAVAVLAVATLGRWLLDPALGDHLPYVTYFVAVALVAWRCGLGPSVFALFAGAWLADFLFFAPRYVWYPHTNTPAHVVGLATYFMVGASSIAVAQAMHRAQRRAEARGELLRMTLLSIGDAVITCDTQARLVGMNAVAEQLTGWTQQEAAGRPLNEVFHIVNEDTRAQVESPVDKVLAEGKIVGLANHTVLIAKDNSERGIDDSAAPIRDTEGNLIGVVLVFRDITEARKLNRAVRLADARKAAILDTALDCIVTIDHEGKVIDFNPACEKTFGYKRDEAVGREMGELIVPPSLREMHRAGLARYLKSNEPRVLNRRIELAAMRSDGSEFPVELAITRISGTGSPMFTGYMRDISERKDAENRQHILTNELNHRIKNMLSVIQSIAHHTARATPEPQAFFSAFSERLIAMSRVHDILTAGTWKGADLRGIAEATFAPYRRADTGAVNIEGPEITLPPETSVSVGLALHELATNAAKYGALSQPSGKIDLSWRELRADTRRIVLDWRERGGPPVRQPAKQGFGTKLIEMVANQLAGEVSVDYPAGGLVLRMEFPLTKASAGTDPAAP